MRRASAIGVTVFVVALLPRVAAQSQRYEVRSSQIQGIDVYDPDAPEFQRFVETLLPEAERRDAISRVLRSSFAVKNTGPRAIRWLIVRYDFLGATGPFGRGVIAHEFREQAPFQPGTVRLATLSLALSDMINGSVDVPLETLKKQAEQGSLSTALGSPYLFASVDSVVFENGGFAGPDVSGKWDDFEAQHREVGTLRAELEGLKTVDAISSKLDAVLAERPALSGASNSGWVARQRMAALLKAKLASGESAFRISLKEWGATRYPPIHREF